MTAKQGDKLLFHFTATSETGKKFTTHDKEPMEIIAGENNQLPPEIGKNLLEMEPGEKKKVPVSLKDGFGKINKNLIFAYKKEKFPPDKKISIGDIYRVKLTTGKTVPASVTEITTTHIILDANNPLAGSKNITFELELLEIEPCNLKE